ncbi:MAG: SDR family NAD(P)-dependent oxidoreductase, partial [Pseudomonadales bacterium]
SLTASCCIFLVNSTLDGQSVLLTGGGSGIGAGTAHYLAERGARVTITGRREQKLSAVANAIGPACCAVSGDITDAADRQRMVDGALAHGGGKIDSLINNAGNMYRGAVESLTEQALLEVFNSNVVAAMLLTGLTLPHIPKDGGAVVFLGSIHNRRAFPGASPYAATKGAIEALTKSLAAELGPRNIRVNCVAPGAVFTEINQRAGLFTDAQAKERLEGMSGLHALGRIGEVAEVAEAIAYFMTAPWTTGTTLEVDGGLALGITNG